MSIAQIKQMYEVSYADLGLGAQRKWPNEDFIRVLATYYFKLPPEERRKVKMLDIGCGSGSNLWAAAREGFDVYGLELSDVAVGLAHKMLEFWGTSGQPRQGDMTNMPFENASFDFAYEAYACCCLDEKQFAKFLDEVARVLKPGGRFYSFHPSKNSDSWKNYAPAKRIDGSTLDSIQRPGSPFCGYETNFRFIAPEEFAAALEQRGMEVVHLEKISRTYHRMTEYSEYVSIVGQKK